MVQSTYKSFVMAAPRSKAPIFLYIARDNDGKNLQKKNNDVVNVYGNGLLVAKALLVQYKTLI